MSISCRPRPLAPAPATVTAGDGSWTAAARIRSGRRIWQPGRPPVGTSTKSGMPMLAVRLVSVPAALAGLGRACPGGQSRSANRRRERFAVTEPVTAPGGILLKPWPGVPPAAVRDRCAVALAGVVRAPVVRAGVVQAPVDRAAVGERDARRPRPGTRCPVARPGTNREQTPPPRPDRLPIGHLSPKVTVGDGYFVKRVLVVLRHWNWARMIRSHPVGSQLTLHNGQSR